MLISAFLIVEKKSENKTRQLQNPERSREKPKKQPEKARLGQKSPRVLREFPGEKSVNKQTECLSEFKKWKC